jgi:uncharacterized protein with NAD-binding domain and iron-sulfur cluster
VVAAVLDDGAEIRAGLYLSALPHDALLALLPDEFASGNPVFSALRGLRTSPITGVHLWLDRVVTQEPYLALLDRTTQWIFNKTKLYGMLPVGARHAVPAPEPAASTAGARYGVPPQPSGTPSAAQYLQLVISASYGLVEKSRQEIVDLCWRELQDALPTAREAQLVKATVVKEVAATFSPAPGCDRLRPGPRSPLPNLYLAGDWTATGWPATMEGAVRSGYLAAEAILVADRRPQPLLCEDLPAQGLSRHWSRR